MGGRKGQAGSAALYRQLFDRFVNYHHLDNLVWVWNANSPGSGGNGPGPYADYFPGAGYADILSVDVYGEFKQSYYDDLLALAVGKPVALGEVGGLPSPAVLKEQTKYAWFMAWSEFIEMANPLANVRAVYYDERALTRHDPRMQQAMEAMHKASAPPDQQLVTPDPLPAAKELLATLRKAAGQGILSGEENESDSPAASSQKLFEITGKHPAIYGAELAGTGAPAVVEEATHQFRDHSLVTLSWRPARPTDERPGKLSDFEWKELLTPGTRLFTQWSAQVDTAAGYLKQLQDAGVPVLWRPYPQLNGMSYWWAGHKAESAALYRQLFDRLVNVHKLRNLVWVWNAASPGIPSGAGPEAQGQWPDYFPGLGYADALAVDLGSTPFSWRRDAELARFAVGKVIGLGVKGWLPTPAMVEQPTAWAWFLSSGTSQPDALRALYTNPHVISRQ